MMEQEEEAEISLGNTQQSVLSFSDPCKTDRIRNSIKNISRKRILIPTVRKNGSGSVLNHIPAGLFLGQHCYAG